VQSVNFLSKETFYTISTSLIIFYCSASTDYDPNEIVEEEEEEPVI
jgi:hypothetical protein